jgi:hypothetical protein
LPAERYQYGEWKTARVNIDYHVEVERHWYSVPYQLTQQPVEIRATAHGGDLSPGHQRGFACPLARPAPPHHHARAPAQGAPAAPGVDAVAHRRVVGTIGPATAQVVERILNGNRIPSRATAPAWASSGLATNIPTPASKPPRGAPWP